MSKEQLLFIKNEKKKKRFVKYSQILILIIFITIWQILADKEIINSFISSSPKNIFNTLISLYENNNLFKHIFVTIKETLIAFSITSILSLLIAIVLYNSNTLSKILDPYLTALNSLPKVALGPLIIIFIGSNTKSIITMAILISIIISIESILNSFKQTDELKIKLLKTYNASKKDIMLNVILQSNRITIINTLKVNISMCLIGVIQGEFLTSKAGIGYLILYGSQVFNLDLVMTGIFLLTIISIIMYKLVLFMSRNKSN